MKSEAAKKAQAKYAKSLADRGTKPLTVMLSAKAHERLDRLKNSYGNKRAVIEALLSGD